MANFSFVEQFANDLANAVRETITEQLAAALSTGKITSNGSGKAAKPNGNKGIKRDMHCRVAGCKNRSKGPRFGYICEEHLKKLSKVEQRKAIEQWKEKARA